MCQNSLIDIIQKSEDGFPLTDAYKSGHRFYMDFVDMLDFFKSKLTKKEYKDIENKILSGCTQTDEQSYLQCMSELVVLYYVMRQLNNSDSFRYQPKYNGGYNPECSVFYGGKTINIEVKCPHMGKRAEIESRDTLKLSFAERVPEGVNYKSILEDLKTTITPYLENSSYSGVEEVPRMDNKLKSYLEHSQKKFPLGDNYFNILVIALEIPSDIDEWYGYLFGDNGAFTANSYINTCYDNVDAVLLCTPVCGLKRWEDYHHINVWHLEETINILLLDPGKECIKYKHTLTEKGKYYHEYGLNMFGSLTGAFLNFQYELDIKNENEQAKLSLEGKYIRFKETDIRIFSEFIESLNGQRA